MDALKLIQSTKNGVLQITVPEHFNNTPLEVIVTPIPEKTAPATKKHQAIKKYFGTAKFANTDVNKSDVYHQ